MTDLTVMGTKAKAAARECGKTGTNDKNEVLKAVADALLKNESAITEANKRDLKLAKENNMKPAMVDRLTITKNRLEGMAEGLRQLTALEDPIGEVTRMWTRPNGLRIGAMRVPLGVIGIIYESRPNVTVDSFGLTFKAGNAVILKGGSDSLESNRKLVEIIREVLKEKGHNPDAIQLIEDTDHAVVTELLHLNAYVDVIIPRGGKGLIKHCVENSSVPVIETGTGNCHIFVDESADIPKAVQIINNAKTQRIGVCNACESLVIHENILNKALPAIIDELKKSNVEVRGDEAALAADSRVVPATEEDWGTEYLDYIISVKTVKSVDEAIEHINRYNTGHSESILTKDYENSQKFLKEIDAAAVYVNASTRFTDGFEFGFGAEIGISTQKLHARGPMGLLALTTTKYIIYGDGQIR